ncbi:MAG: glycosyltransferase family 9 protein [Verrucomicrobiales bacterium]
MPATAPDWFTNWKRFKLKILILKPSSLGDVVQALPVLRLIKKWKPEARAFWWISAPLGPLLEGDPDLEGLFYFRRQGWRHPEYWFGFADEIRRMRSIHFDWVIDLQSLARSGMVAWLANGATTIGLHDDREGAAGFYDLAIPRPSYQTHAVDWYLQTLKRLQVPTDGPFEWLPRRPTVAHKVEQESASFEKIVILNPGARWENKRWPIGYYKTLAAEFLKLPGVGIAALGSGNEASFGKEIATVDPKRILDLTGKTSLPEMVEWIRRSNLMVSNDTGPMHIAAALQVPLVPLFGPTTPARTGPYGQISESIQRVDLACVPCMKSTCHNPIALECLTSISPLQVFEAALPKLLNKKPGVFPG